MNSFMVCRNGEEHEFDKDDVCECGMSLAQYVQKLKAYQTMLSNAELMISSTNTSKSEMLAECLHDALCRTHPTIQQQFIKAIAGMCKRLAEDMNTDGRNEAAIDWCREVANLDTNFPLI